MVQIVAELNTLRPNQLPKALEDLSLIEQAIKNTDPNLGDVYKKKAFSWNKRKEEVDSMIKYCTKCKRCWAQLPHSVDAAKFRYYPKNQMPTIGKKRKTCKICRRKKC